MIVDGPRSKAPGLTYIARRQSTGTYKIGTTWRWQNRAFDFRCIGIRDLELIALTRGADVELRLHAYFEPHHIGHEWFTADIAPEVEKIRLGTFDWDALPSRGWCVTKPFQTKASLTHWGPLPRFAGLSA